MIMLLRFYKAQLYSQISTLKVHHNVTLINNNLSNIDNPSSLQQLNGAQLTGALAQGHYVMIWPNLQTLDLVLFEL